MVERHVVVVNVLPERRQDYLDLHARVWPEVEATLRTNGFADYSIHILDHTLIGSYAYVGDDHDASLARIAADPTTQDWWALTAPCQTGFGADTSPGWREAREVWRLNPFPTITHESENLHHEAGPDRTPRR